MSTVCVALVPPDVEQMKFILLPSWAGEQQYAISKRKLFWIRAQSYGHCSWLTNDRCIEDGSIYAFLPIDPRILAAQLSPESLRKFQDSLSEYIQLDEQSSPADPVERLSELLNEFAQRIPTEDPPSFDHLRFETSGDPRILSAMGYYEELIEENLFKQICERLKVQRLPKVHTYTIIQSLL